MSSKGYWSPYGPGSHPQEEATRHHNGADDAYSGWQTGLGPGIRRSRQAKPRQDHRLLLWCSNPRRSHQEKVPRSWIRIPEGKLLKFFIHSSMSKFSCCSSETLKCLVPMCAFANVPFSMCAFCVFATTIVLVV